MISGGHKKLRPLDELRSEPATRSNDTGQWKPYFDCCHLTITWIFLRTLNSYNPGQKFLGQWSSNCNFLPFLDILIKQCNLLKITCTSPSSPIILWKADKALRRCYFVSLKRQSPRLMNAVLTNLDHFPETSECSIVNFANQPSLHRALFNWVSKTKNQSNHNGQSE